jgi:hypothetical protein
MSLLEDPSLQHKQKNLAFAMDPNFPFQIFPGQTKLRKIVQILLKPFLIPDPDFQTHEKGGTTKVR